MAARIIITLSLFTLIIRANTQFYDLFQSFQPLAQNYRTTRPDFSFFQNFGQTKPSTDNEGVKRETWKETSKVVSNDRVNRPTVKPRKTIASPINTTPKSVRKNTKNASQVPESNKTKQLIRRHYNDRTNTVSDYSSIQDRPNSVTTKPSYRPNTQKPGSYNERPVNSEQNNAYNKPSSFESIIANPRPNYGNKPTNYESNFNNRPNSKPGFENVATTRPTYNQKPSNSFNTQTYRPGVKPAPVDTNRPPITNRPPTQAPFAVYPRPTDSSVIRFPEDPDTSPEVIVGSDEDSMSSVEKRRYISLAEKMCDKYKSLNVKKVEAIPLLPSPDPVQVNVSVCPPTTVPLVVGGKVVNIGEFPHMALLGWTKIQDSGYSWKCGGSLISDQFVLTAGHCAFQEKDDSVVSGAPRVVQIGSSYLDDTGALVVKVLQVIRHPKYIQTRSYYDIALVKLVKPVTFSQVVKPACLGDPPGVGEPIIATGWGRTEFGGTQSLELRSVSIPIWDMDQCREVLGTSRKLPNGPSRDSQICAGEKQGGKDTCQGDSGGPAQIQDGCVWRVVAVTSVGRSCGAPNTPALYATLHKAFIASQVFGNPSTSNKQTDKNNSQNGNINSHPSTSQTGNINQNRRPGNQNNNANVNNNGNTNSVNKIPNRNENQGNWDSGSGNNNKQSTGSNSWDSNTNNNRDTSNNWNSNTNDNPDNGYNSWSTDDNNGNRDTSGYNSWNANNKNENNNGDYNPDDSRYENWNGNRQNTNQASSMTRPQNSNNKYQYSNVDNENRSNNRANNYNGNYETPSTNYNNDRYDYEDYSFDNNRNRKTNSRPLIETTRRPNFQNGGFWPNFGFK